MTQQLTLLKELAARIREDEKALEGLLEQSPALQHVRSLPGMGPILAAVVVTTRLESCVTPSFGIFDQNPYRRPVMMGSREQWTREVA